MSKPDLFQRGNILVVAGILIVAVSAIALLVFSSSKEVQGRVVDGANGRPLPEALVKASDRQLPVDGSGAFTASGLGFGGKVSAEARGYLPASAMVNPLSDRVEIALTPRVLEGVVKDSATGKPVPGVALTAGALSATSDAEGRFRLERIEPGAEVVARAEGFLDSRMRYDGQQPGSALAMNPSVLAVKVTDRYTREPLEGVELSDGKANVRTDRAGQAQLQYLKNGATVAGKLDGYAPAQVVYTGQESAEMALRPDTLSGVVTDPAGKPLAGAAVSAGSSKATTDERGAFKLAAVPENPRLVVSANGFQNWQKEIKDQSTVEVKLEMPFAAKGLYLTYYGVGDDGLREHVLELADTTEINAVVIDIKGDRGWLAYRSAVPMVQQIGAQQDIMIPDPKKFLADLKKRGIYAIARIVAFKDNPLSQSRPDLAVMNAGTGKPWVDNEGLSWVDATREEAWDYNIALAVEAIEFGFQEVQFDYVRFPTDASAGNSLDSIRFSKENTTANRVAAISGFLSKARDAIHAKGGKVSADIFGYVVLRDDDMGIGQNLEAVAKAVDYVSPMVYPNLFWDGIDVGGEVKYGGQKSGLYPYEIVFESMKAAVKRIGPEKLRPWLQYYDDYITGKGYGAAEVEAQKRATYDTGIAGWLFWDPLNKFSKGGFKPE